MPTSVKNQQGFTLLELLTVVAIMAIISGMSLMSHRETQNFSNDQAVLSEMRQLQQAVIYFLKDQNTYTADSPADIDFLLLKNSNENWNPDYRKGWRGPYIKGFDISIPYVSIADNTNTGLEMTGNGSPDSGTVIRVHAKPDTYSKSSKGNYFVWGKLDADISENNNPEIPRLGRPYLFFDLVTYGTAQSKARIVSMGADGIYEFPLDCDPSETDNTDPDFCLCDLDQTDITHGRFCEREDVCVSQGDDLVLCI